jgi:repressor LexA
MVSRSTEKSPLTELQRRVLDFIESRRRDSGVPPTYREIQEHFGYRAVGTVQDHVKALVRKGYLAPSGLGDRRGARTLLPPDAQAPEGVRRMPIYGEIAAGPLRETPQVELGTLVVAESLASERCFALRVTGDSMVDAGIFDGDFVIVEPTPRVKHGDIVVALVAGETTVKRYEVRTDGPYLVPQNPRLAPLKLADQRWEIQGCVVGLQRRIR